jgi:hypothetical protein
VRLGQNGTAFLFEYYETREIYALTPFRHASLEFRVFTHPGARHGAAYGKRPTAAEREEIAKWMMHHPGTQLRTYTKTKRTLTGEGGKKKRRKAVKVSDLCI